MAKKHAQKIPAVFVTHSHWDREWYKTLDRYRFRLVELFDRLIEIQEKGLDYHSFWLDGQTIPVQDYLKVCPEKRERVEQLLRSKKLLIGPWLVLADEHRVSGEATVRNLLLGTRQARAYGQENRIGYLPDRFGHVSQMPQILAGFGIDNALFWRGYRIEDIERSENIWEGADGTRITAICLVRGYSNTRGVAPESEGGTFDRINLFLEDVKRFSASGALLLMNGIDHALPVKDVPAAIQAMTARFPDLDIRHGSIADFLDEVRGNFPQDVTLKGEMTFVPGLGATLAGRLEQKQAHRNLERLLIYYAEPLWTLARLKGHVPPRGFLKRAWDLLVKNESHDSIGAQIDDVTQDVMTRYRRGLDIVDELTNRSLYAFNGQVGDYVDASLPTALTVFNPCAWTREGLIEVEADFPEELAPAKVCAFMNGEPVPAEVVTRNTRPRKCFHDYLNPTSPNVIRIKVLLHPEALPPFSLTRIALKPEKGGLIDVVDVMNDAEETNPRRHRISPIVQDPGVLDNGILRVRVHEDGRIEIEDKTTGRQLSGLNRLTATQNIGGIYELERPHDAEQGGVRGGVVANCEVGSLRWSVRVHAELVTFPGKDKDPFVSPFVMTVRLLAGSRSVSIRTEMECNDPSIRLQSLFPLPDGMGKLRAHSAFDIPDREPARVHPLMMDSGGMSDVNSAIRAARYFLQAYGNAGSFVIANRGTEACFQESPDMIRLVILEGMYGQGLAGGPPEEVRHVASDGKHNFEYALALLPDDDPITALRVGYEFNLPVRTMQTFGGEIDELPGSMLGLTAREWILACVKPAEERDSTIVRFWNASTAEVTGFLKFNMPYSKAYRVQLDETRIKELTSTQKGIELRSGPKQIISIEFEH